MRLLQICYQFDTSLDGQSLPVVRPLVLDHNFKKRSHWKTHIEKLGKRIKNVGMLPQLHGLSGYQNKSVDEEIRLDVNDFLQK